MASRARGDAAAVAMGGIGLPPLHSPTIPCAAAWRHSTHTMVRCPSTCPCSSNWRSFQACCQVGPHPGMEAASGAFVQKIEESPLTMLCSIPCSCCAGLLLLHTRSRPWFSAQRDRLLLATWLWTIGWVCVVRKLSSVPSSQFVGWVTVLGLALPLRFHRQAPLSYLATVQLVPATNAYQLLRLLLPLVCAYFSERGMQRRFAAGLV